MEDIGKNSYALSGLRIGGGLGNIAGIIYAIKVKSGFWKGFGFFALGGLTVGGLGYGIGSLIKKKGVIVVEGKGDDLSITTQDKLSQLALQGNSGSSGKKVDTDIANPFDRFKFDPSKFQIKTPDFNPSYMFRNNNQNNYKI